MANPTNSVTYIISLEAEQAVKDLAVLNAQTSSWDMKITAVTAKVRELSASWGTSFNATVGILKNADTEMQKATNSAGVFGTQVTNSATKATKSLSNIGFRQVAQEAEEASPRVVRSIDAIRIALGAIVAMIVFQVIQAFTNFFGGAIKNAEDLQGALYNVANAERIMSQQGIDIAPKDLSKMATELKALVPIMSQIDATKAVSSLALFTKDLGYTKTQIDDLSKAVGTLYVRNQAMGLSFEQVLSQVQTGLLTGRAQGIRDLGVSISEAAIEQEALRMGLVKTDKEFQNLTGDIQTQVKAQAMLSIIVRNTAQEQGDLGKFMETDTGKIKTFQASIEDFKTATGQAFLPLLGILAEVGGALLHMYQNVQKLIAFFDASAATAFAAPFIVAKEAINGNIKSIDDIRNVYNSTYKTISDWIKLHTGLTMQEASAMDTATGSAQTLGSSLADISKIDLSSLNNSILSLQERLSQLNRDFAQKNQNYQDEFNTKMSRMQEDYQTEVAKTIQDFNNKRADAEAQYRNAQLDAEAKYQEQMRELRTKYLFDLEDALRNRDARQVLRLQAQYKMDKENLTKNFEIENAARARQYKLELAQLARQEAQKLAEMAAAEATKEARAREDFAREQAQRKQEYENQLADLKQSWDDRLKEEADKIAENAHITGKGVDLIYQALKKYYEKGGVFDGLYQYSFDSLKATGASMLAELATTLSQYMAMMGSIPGMVGTPSNVIPYRGGGGTTGTPPPGGGGGGMTVPHSQAQGGMAIASKPTNVTFGDAGIEAAIFLPLSKIMSNLPITGGGGGGGESMNGQLKVLLELSPDLEARITENTLGKAAKVITQVYRSRH